MKRIDIFAGEKVPEPLRLFQLTDSFEEPSCHIYMEAQIFTPDSKRLVLHRSAHPHGSDQYDPRHAYFLCDLKNGGALAPLTSETGASAPCISPDGKYFYYFVRQFDPKTFTGSILFKRCALDGSGRLELGRIGPDTKEAQPAFCMYPLSTVSSDGRRIAIASPLVRPNDDNGFPEHALWIFDTATGEVSIPVRGKHFCNLHMQYSRSPLAPHDIMIQHNHGSFGCEIPIPGQSPAQHVAALDAESGFALRRISASSDPKNNNTGYGIDIHLIRDDGTGWREFGWGRDGVESCQGHQCWRGESDWAISSTLLFSTPSAACQELVESRAVPGYGHRGKRNEGTGRNVLSRKVNPPHFLHFATDRAGKRLVSDYEADNGEWHLYLGGLGVPGQEAASLRFTLNLGSRKVSPWHPHPFLSPDGEKVFFNSSADGRLHAYCLFLS